MEANFYLKKLIIQNFATFKNQTIHFQTGFNAIVGETGSGKSLVLDALQLILGGRADKRIVRKDTDSSLIEATFHCLDQGIIQFLESEGFPFEGHELLIKRIVFKNGSTKTYMNHLNCPVHFLSAFSKKYIDLVGQFENQKLLSETYQLQLLDHYAKLSSQVLSYQKELLRFKTLSQDLTKLENSQNHREQRLDYLNYQLQEIEKLNPSSQDEEDLLKKKYLLMNLEKNQRLSFQVKDIFEGGEGKPGLLHQMKSLSSLILRNKDTLEDQISEMTEIEDKLLQVNEEIEKKLSQEIDPSELDGVLEKIDAYQKLKKKFGGNVELILESQKAFGKEKKELEEQQFNLQDLTALINLAKERVVVLSHELHQKRLMFSEKLSRELTTKVQGLKMNGATIKLGLEQLQDFNDYGATRVSFVAETNPGEGYFKVKEVASGGELSRILLAVRQILSAYDSISIFLFDEIDTGIGGETAVCIGKALKGVSLNGQVIAITHLPQIAQFADTLILVQKEIQSKDHSSRTESSVKEVRGKMVKNEIKNMTLLTQ